MNKSDNNNYLEYKELLEGLFDKYNRKSFIENDPISIPHRFTKKRDIEISGFLAASIAWGQRSQIIKNANYLMQLMDFSPCDFVLNASKDELQTIRKFYYRTFKGVDLVFFIHALREVYENHNGLEGLFTSSYNNIEGTVPGLKKLYTLFHAVHHEQRSIKHIANISRGSSAKRLNMYLRWMVRSDDRGVDFGLWRNIPSSALYIPLDVHSGRTARELALLTRKQDDWKAVVELTQNLRQIDKEDPVKYDFALFGASIDKELKSPAH